MNRRKLLAIGGIGITSIAGCTALKDALLGGESEDTEEPSSNSSSPTGSTNPAGSEPDISAEQANSTDTQPNKRKERPPENTSRNETQPTQQHNESAQDPPDSDPTQAVEIVNHEMIFNEADDPNYDQDELYLRGAIRNASDHPLQGVRLDGYALASGEQVGHEFIEYASLEPGGERQFELPFFVENPSSVEEIDPEITAAQWA